MNADLASVLEYLQGIGWEEVYVPAGARARGSEAPAATGAGTGEMASGARPVPAAGAARRAPTGSGAPRTAVAPASAPIPTAPPAERASRLAEVAVEAGACVRCKLAGGRRTVVFGTGNADADLMFIGEGPGAEEDRQGLPFVGPAGQLLNRIIGAIGLTREQVYIANVVKCRPPGNRDPQPDEVAACRGFLEEQVRLVGPRVLVALGRVAAQTLLGNELPVGRLRGDWHRVFGVPLRVTYHPAALLRNEALKRPTWEDMQVVRDRLAAGP